jgi:hypothetical protein
MAALAAAQAEGDGCAAAARTAEANDTSLVACSLDGLDVVVRVSRRAPTLVVRLLAWLGQPAGDVEATARAGPPEPAPG